MTAEEKLAILTKNVHGVLAEILQFTQYDAPPSYSTLKEWASILGGALEKAE